MDLEDWASIAVIAEAVLVAVSVILIYLELRRSNELAKAANMHALVELSSPFNLQLVQNRQMAELWFAGADQFDTMDRIDQKRYRELLTWWLILHENIYYQYDKRLVDRDAYLAWDRDLKSFVRKQNLGRHWNTIKGAYLPEFATHVDELIQANGD
jgi:hypothetical protein